MQFSIIVPYHNEGELFRRCLDSLVYQDFPGIEIILVGDHADAATINIADEYAAKYSEKVKAFSSMRHGVSAARNAGLCVARGEVIGFCDADDSYVADTIQKVAEIFTSKNADIVVGGINKFDKNNILLEPDNIEEHIQLWTHEKLAYHTIYDQNIMGSVWNKFFKQELLVNINFDETLSYCEDNHFNILVLCGHTKGTVAVTNRRVYNYCYNEKSVTNSSEKTFDDLGKIKAIEALEKIAELKSPYKKLKGVAQAQMSYLAYAACVNFQLPKDKEKVNKNLIYCYGIKNISLFFIDPIETLKRIIKLILYLFLGIKHIRRGVRE